MPLVLDHNHVQEIYAEARERKWVLPAFNTENLTTMEAVLAAVDAYGKSIHINNLPIIIGITNTYPPRPQSLYYTQTRKWQIGLALFLADLDVLTCPESPFAGLRVMIHLDHIQWDRDKELLNWDMKRFSSIFYDASALPLELNIQKTAAFVEQHGHDILIEGACAEISGTAAGDMNNLTLPEQADQYFHATGVDILVPNLGTEHRASVANIEYQGQSAREIAQRVGPRLCLHGSSSVAKDKLAHLFADGICKVNIWTALERDSSPVLFQNLLQNAAKIIGVEKSRQLLRDKLLGNRTDTHSAVAIDYYTSTYRDKIVFQSMKEIITGYLKLWYV
jgi:fructose-bisphosphate aldolase class II